MTKPLKTSTAHLPFDDFARRIRNGESPMAFPFDHLVDDLKRQGFVLGVEHYIRLNAVLDRFGDRADPMTLKTLLCPVFAATPEQQDRFYKTFDRYFAPLADDEDAVEPAGIQESEGGKKPSTEPPVIRKRLYFLIALLLIALSGLFVQWFGQPPPEPVKPTASIKEVPPAAQGPQQVERKPNIKVSIPLSVGPTPELTFYQRYGNALIAVFALTPLILFLMNEAYRRYRRSLALERGRRKKPPHALSIDIHAPPTDFLMTRPFYAAANRMRQRLEGDAVRLDIPQTIDATIHGGGFPDFVYRPVTRPAEYLFLIDRSNPGDHYAAFMETAADALENEGVHVHILFFDGDPQVVYRRKDGERHLLSDLAGRLSDCRLALVGTADGLLDPMTGEPEEWTELFESWPDRAVLTPAPPKDWGMREVALARSFVVLPATVAGLEALVDCFESPNPPDLRGWVKTDDGKTAPSDFDPASLRAYLEDEAAFRWLCACAVYPEVNWRLTLHLGIVMGALDESGLLRLIRLPWFRAGAMPEETRLKLIGELNRTQLEAVREAIYTVLEKNSPEQDSGAMDAHRLTLAVHRSLIAADRREKIEARREAREGLEKMGQERVLRDMTLLKILEGAPASPLSLVLPRRFNRIFFKHGVPLFGLRSRVWGALAVMAALAAFWGLPRPDVPTVPAQEKLEMTFVHIPARTFMMGSPEDEPGRDSDEKLHEVTLTNDFYMQTTEVTQGQWKAVMGENPSNFKDCGDDCPVEQVSWEDVQEFIRRLDRIEPVGKYRLPTEAEWEYSARAGTTTPFAFGRCLSTDDANYDGNYPLEGCPEGKYRSKTLAVGTLAANAWGLFDMHGNVYEWCQDWFGGYPNGPVEDPVGPHSGSGRVFRGGSWNDFARNCRSAGRYYWQPGIRDGYLGFRLARSLP